MGFNPDVVLWGLNGQVYARRHSDRMLDITHKVLDGFSDIVRLFSLLLISGVMISVGLTLAAGGRPEAAIPLLFSALCLIQVPSLVKRLYQHLTGHY